MTFFHCHLLYFCKGKSETFFFKTICTGETMCGVYLSDGFFVTM